MKLKKIVSLALAGVLAVSMLAGCNTSSSDSSSSSSSEATGSATGVSAKISALLDESDKITMADNSAYAGYLSSALKKANLEAEDLLKASTEAWDSSATDFSGVLTELQELFTNNVLNYSDTSQTVITDFAAPTDKTEKVYMSFGVYPGALSQDVVLQKIADQLNKKLTATNLPSIITVSSDYYDEAYTGSVSIQKVSDGSASAWFVVVTVANKATKH